ncbi:MAG: hypothetical protein DCC59_10875 [Chloroflexi bacterium]|nr:hypothetical protein [Chloroflexi bacterium CFX1]MCK6567770.1 hypothetical protein [Anaerolineales bacterium]MCQ3954119.1 hypothetical protein [Chloroflexota bacterium]MDL1920893.1 hypothetical protein [Chloroflexi bacterium CFX5]NUQ60646.1 hypothetical protein [Anaerolineales bacterium]
MTTSDYKARQVRAKTREVFEYDHDDSKPGKPLHILIPGGLIALAVLGLIIFIAYLTWFEGNLAESTGTFLCLLLAPFYVGGVFLFSYGYELYNIPRAIRLTAIIVFVTLAAVVIVAVLFFLLGNMKDGGSGSSSSGKSSSSRSTSSSSKGASSKGMFGGALAGGLSQKSSSSSGGSLSSSGGHYHSGGPVFIGGGGGTRVETREVTKEVVKEVPKEPMPITCPFCNRSYIPVDFHYVCPGCGAATPKDLIEKSQLPEE